MKIDRTEKKKLLPLVAGVLLIIILLVAWFLFSSGDNRAANKKAGDSHPQQNADRSRESLCSYMHDYDEPRSVPDKIEYFKELEKRAPADIGDDLTTIRKTYEQIERHPEKEMQIALQSAEAGDAYVDWYPANCKN